MLNSTNWVGYISAVTLIAVSFAAAFLAPKHQQQQPAPGPGPSPSAAEITAPQAQLPPIQPATVDAKFMGTHTFGLWTLVCENVHSPSAPGTERRICRSNAQKRVRANNEVLLAAGFNVLYAGPNREPAVLFRLPPTANASDHIDFAIDDNTTFQAPMGRCSPSGCIVQGILPAEALAQMKTGRILSVIYTATVNQEPRRIRVDQLLYGFPESFEALTKAKGP
ncbi:MAG: hypothetical protein GC190_09620 [Alphaproteobacteria bacterium]|nr:hypothetical protein [Alphaproteobacteria bacterium]